MGQQLSYDTEGQLASWQNAPTSPTTTAGYLYDGAGNRVAQQVTASGTTTTTRYLGSLEAVTTNGSTTTTTDYFFGPTGLLAETVNGASAGLSSITYLVTNAQGSVIAALNRTGGTGGVAGSRLYAPYGSGRYSSGAFPTDYGYTGQRADAATGLDYYGARYYDPALGQFTSADTVLDGFNRYAYVKGNPTTFTDPTGHKLDDEEEPGDDGGQIEGSDNAGAGGGGDGGGDGSSSVGTTGSTAVETTTTPPLKITDSNGNTVELTDDTATITYPNGDTKTMSLDDYLASQGMGEGETLNEPGSNYYQTEDQQANAENPATPTTPQEPQNPNTPNTPDNPDLNRIDNLRQQNNVTSPTRNAAIADYNIDGQQGTIGAFSGSDPNPPGSFLATKVDPSTANFQVAEVNGYMRDGDSEYKIFENVANMFSDDPQVSGTLTVISEHTPCPSCEGVSAQFQAAFPNINVELRDAGRPWP